MPIVYSGSEKTSRKRLHVVEASQEALESHDDICTPETGKGPRSVVR
jgi:hypothetical protein